MAANDLQIPSVAEEKSHVYTSNPTSVAYTGTHGRTALLTAGLWEITSSTDAFFLQGGNDVEATGSSNPLWAKVPRLIYVGNSVNDTTANGSNGYVSVIQQSAGGTLYCIRRKRA